MIFRNVNGHDYLILDKCGIVALLAQLDMKKFVVAYGLMDESWGGASYWDDIHGAYQRYCELLKKD